MEKHAKQDCCSYKVLLSVNSRLQCTRSCSHEATPGAAAEAAAHTCPLAHQCVQQRASTPVNNTLKCGNLN